MYIEHDHINIVRAILYLWPPSFQPGPFGDLHQYILVNDPLPLSPPPPSLFPGPQNCFHLLLMVLDSLFPLSKICLLLSSTIFLPFLFSIHHTYSTYFCWYAYDVILSYWKFLSPSPSLPPEPLHIHSVHMYMWIFYAYDVIHFVYVVNILRPTHTQTHTHALTSHLPPRQA